VCPYRLFPRIKILSGPNKSSIFSLSIRCVVFFWKAGAATFLKVIRAFRFISGSDEKSDRKMPLQSRLNTKGGTAIEGCRRFKDWYWCKGNFVSGCFVGRAATAED